MRIKNKEIKIGQVVKITEKHNEKYHHINVDRKFLGWVVHLGNHNSLKEIEICPKKIKADLEDVKTFKEVFTKGFKNIAKANFGSFSSMIFVEDQIKDIEVLK